MEILSDITKLCKKCNQDKPIDEFHNKTAGKYGKAHVCKPCMKILNAKYYDNKKAMHKRRSVTHNLDDHKIYPLYHKFISSSSLSVYTDKIMKAGDTVIIKGESFRLSVSREFTGIRKKAILRYKETYHYDFSLISLNR